MIGPREQRVLKRAEQRAFDVIDKFDPKKSAAFGNYMKRAALDYASRRRLSDEDSIVGSLAILVDYCIVSNDDTTSAMLYIILNRLIKGKLDRMVEEKKAKEDGR